MTTISIQQIKSDPTLAKSFLKDCFSFFQTLLLEEEITKRKKLITGCGPNKHDYADYLVDSYYLNRKGSEFQDLVVDKWVNHDKIFKYRKQLAGIIRKYEYLMSTRGI